MAQGVPAATAARVSHLPPVGSLFAAFLGYNPMATLLGPAALHHMTAAQAHYITGRSFFPHLISAPFGQGLQKAFDFAAVVCLLGAVASLLRGGKFHYTEPGDEHRPGGAGRRGGGRDRAPAGRAETMARDHGREEPARRPSAGGQRPTGGRRPAAGTPGLRISDAAARAGVSARTLRYYDELGLLSPSQYTAGGRAPLPGRATWSSSSASSSCARRSG